MPAEYGACLKSFILGIIPHSVEPAPVTMPRVLLIKISSLGDVVHNLPVVSDMRAALPGAGSPRPASTVARAVSISAAPEVRPRLMKLLPL